MPAVKRLIIADSHLGQRPGDVEEMESLLRRASEAGVGEVIYLGDAFQYLIGMSKFWTAAVRRILEVWSGVRSAGMRVVLVEGNRDFFLDESDLASEMDLSGRRYEFLAGARRYRLTHGDRVNRRDLQYLFWATLSKSFVARVWARVLPRPVAVAIVRSVEARLASTNFRFRYRMPNNALRRAAELAWREGVDVMLWGHFHGAWEHLEDDRTAMVVPAWLSTRHAILVAEDGAWEWVDSTLTPDGTISRIP